MWKEKVRENREAVVLASLFLVSVFLRLIALSHPQAIIFDEVYYARYINSYAFSGEYLFDVHPPHSKILIALVSKLLGYQGGVDFQQIGQNLSGVNVFAMRFLPALFGSFLPLLIFAFVRVLGGGLAVAALAGFAISLDGGFVIQTRTVAQDGMLIFWIFAGATVLLATKDSKPWWSTLLAGAFAGMAVGSKLTGLVGPFISVVVLFQRRESFKKLFKHLLLFIGAMFLVYVAGWWVHFRLMYGPGSGDAFYQRTGHFWTDLMNLQRVMYQANARIADYHRYASHWYGWPFMHKPIYYWVQDERVIYFIGNPVVWYGALALFICGFLGFLTRTKKWKPILGFPLLGYFVSYVPYFPVSRPLFLYHYMTPLVFSLVTGLLWLENSRYGKQIFASRVRLGIVGAALLCGFLLISPFVYGFDLPGQFHLKLFEIIPNWR